MKNQINWFDHLFNVLSVIIGVSLAFLVNDSAESRKKQNEYNAVIDSFLEELYSDKTTYIDYQIPDNKDQAKVISQVLQLIEREETDSLIQKFSRAIGINNYHPPGVTFSSLQSAGRLEIIEDFELRKELSTYHTILAEEARLRGQIQVDFYMDQLMPWLLINTDFKNPDTQALNDPHLSNLLILYQSFLENKVSNYERMVDQIDYLEEKLKNLKNGEKE